jgi:Transcriptional activator TraM
MVNIDNIISYLANIHGVVVGKDDPILIAYSLNEKMIGENKEAQKELLSDFKTEIENISGTLSSDILEKAERIINASIVANKNAIDNQIKKSVGETVEAINEKFKTQSKIADSQMSGLKTFTYFNMFILLINITVNVVSLI